jgi:hypothetical protein
MAKQSFHRPATNKYGTRKRAAGKQRKNKDVKMTRLLSTYTGEMQFWDYQQFVGVTNTATSLLCMDPLLTSGGLMNQYPQNCKGYWNGSVYRLRGRITIKRIELRSFYIGAQSTVLAAGDLFNICRFAFYKVGAAYSDATELYLGQGLTSGSDIDDIAAIYLDKTYTLSSTAFDSANGYNVPATKTDFLAMDCNIPLQIYSTTPTGTGAAWNTVMGSLKAEVVSDSLLAPHPTLNVSMRFFFVLSN